MRSPRLQSGRPAIWPLRLLDPDQVARRVAHSEVAYPPELSGGLLQNLDAGAELYGGLGDRYSFGLKQTSQYAGPTLALNAPAGFTYVFSPQFGLNDNSIGAIWRFKVSYEFQQVRDIFRRK